MQEIPDKVVKDLCKNLTNNTSVAKDGKYEWELCHNQVEGFYLVRWDKQGFGVDFEIPDKLRKGIVSNMTDIQKQGYDAYSDDEYAECPYSADTEKDFYQDWTKGWLMACDEATDYGRN